MLWLPHLATCQWLADPLCVHRLCLQSALHPETQSGCPAVCHMHKNEHRTCATIADHQHSMAGCAGLRWVLYSWKMPNIFSNSSSNTFQQVLGVWGTSPVMPGWFVLDGTVGTCGVQEMTSLQVLVCTCVMSIMTSFSLQLKQVHCVKHGSRCLTCHQGHRQQREWLAMLVLHHFPTSHKTHEPQLALRHHPTKKTQVSLHHGSAA